MRAGPHRRPWACRRDEPRRNPTFGESEIKVEAFLLDYCGDLYDRAIEIDFLARLRDIKCFVPSSSLSSQIAQDVEQTRQIQ